MRNIVKKHKEIIKERKILDIWDTISFVFTYLIKDNQKQMNKNRKV